MLIIFVCMFQGKAVFTNRSSKMKGKTKNYKGDYGKSSGKHWDNINLSSHSIF